MPRDAGRKPGGSLERLTPLVVALTLVGCARTVHTISYGPPSNVRTTMQRQVEHAVYAGEGDPEIRSLRQRLAANANDLDARIMLARAYGQRSLPDLALEHYRFAAAQFPDSAIAALGVAATLRQMGATKEALQFLNSRPNQSWELLALKGIIEDDDGDLQAAETAHRAALALNPSRTALHNNLGYNLLLQHQPEQAAAEFRRALELDPHSQVARNNLASALAQQSRFKEAIAEWQRVSDAATAHNNMAVVLMEQGRSAEARSELEEALRARRDFPPALANLALLSEQDGQPAALPPAAPHVNLWKRFTSTFGAALGAPRAAGSGAGEGK
jgi:Tfp pilus assembly protein PilF